MGTEYPLYHFFACLLENLPRPRQPQPDPDQCLQCHLWRFADLVESVVLCQSDPVAEFSTTIKAV